MRKFKTTIEPRISDIDFLNHVHTTRFIEYALAAWDKATRTSCGELAHYLKNNNLVWVISAIEIAYLRPLTLSDTIDVYTWMDEVLEKETRVGFTIMKNDVKVAAEGKLLFTLFNLHTGRSKKIPDEVKTMAKNVESAKN